MQCDTFQGCDLHLLLGRNLGSRPKYNVSFVGRKSVNSRRAFCTFLVDDIAVQLCVRTSRVKLEWQQSFRLPESLRRLDPQYEHTHFAGLYPVPTTFLNTRTSVPYATAEPRSRRDSQHHEPQPDPATTTSPLSHHAQLLHPRRTRLQLRNQLRPPPGRPRVPTLSVHEQMLPDRFRRKRSIQVAVSQLRGYGPGSQERPTVMDEFHGRGAGGE